MIKVISYPNLQFDDSKQDENIINQIFDITYMAMTEIIPSANKKDDDYRIWRKSHTERLNNGTKYILLYNDEILKGYLSYEIRENHADIFIGDVIIHSDYQGDGKTIFRLLHTFIKECKNCEFTTIRTYANNLNKRSQGIIEKAGFIVDEQRANGNIYCIDRNCLLKTFRKYISRFDM